MPEQKSVQIKICGITGKEEIRWLNEEDVSYAGFVLYEKSTTYSGHDEPGNPPV